MIQRIQSVWLLLAATAMALAFKFSFYSGEKLVSNTTTKSYFSVNASTNFIGLISSIAFAALCFVAILFFKNRKMQMKLIALAIVLGLANLYFLYHETTRFLSGTFSISAIFPVIAIGFAISAVHGVWKDEKKIKELNSNRLR